MTAKRRLTFKIFLFLIFTDLLETFAQFCFKKSVFSANSLGINNLQDALLFVRTIIPSPFLWMGFLAVLVIFITWVTILSKVDLSVAVPVASFSYITVPLISSIFLHEHISNLRWSGIFFILIGVILVSASSRRQERPA
ncbi:MAG: EamA family transporter [Candidatus Omnitrophota bacterium]|nr:EamA family transporter [Candidatus Omnitrophota bacterium]